MEKRKVSLSTSKQRNDATTIILFQYHIGLMIFCAAAVAFNLVSASSAEAD